MTEAQCRYRDYLKSEHWKCLRDEAFRVHGTRCYHCNSKKNLQVHHHTYRTPWSSCTVADVHPLCNNCHKAEHGIEPVARKAPKPVKTPAQLAKKAKKKAERQARAQELSKKALKRRARRLDIIMNARAGNSHWLIFPAPRAELGAELDPDKTTVGQEQSSPLGTNLAKRTEQASGHKPLPESCLR
jgi:hypothetical protein